MIASDTTQVLQYSQQHNCWCVHPTLHTNYLDVVNWCHVRWGNHSIDGRHQGTWSYANGDFYGLIRELHGNKFTDYRIFFSFENQDDAVIFMLRWV